MIYETLEITRTANGYIVRPPYQLHKNMGPDPQDTYVFNDYQKLCDKLFELLNAKEQK